MQQSASIAGNTAVRPNHLSGSISSSELNRPVDVPPSSSVSEQTIRKGIGKWNPFEDPTPFSQMTEELIFDAEFDAIRHRGSQNS